VLGDMSLLAPLCAQLSPASARAISEPGGLMTWGPADWVMEATAVLLTLSGRETCRQLGLGLTRDAAGGVLAPMAKTALALFGGSPATLYPRVQTYTTMLMRGLTISYAESDPRGGTLTLQSHVPMHDGFVAVWEGVFLFVQEACGAKGGQVRPTRLEAKGLRAHVAVSW